MLDSRVHPTLTSPLDRNASVIDALADSLDALGLQQEVIIDEVDRTVPELLEIFELVDDVLWTPGPPLAFVEDRNVTEHAGPRTPTRRLHGREPFQRQHGRHVKRHGFDKVQRQGFAGGGRPLIEVTIHCPAGILNHTTIPCPGEALNSCRIVQALNQVENQLFTITTADKIHLGTLELDQLGVETGKDPSKR